MTTPEPPEPPNAPSDEECCQNGCEELCVFEIYRLQKADYEEKLKTWQNNNNH